MDAHFRWPTSIVELSDTRPGDLLVVGHGDLLTLVFKVGELSREIGIMLAELGPAEHAKLPEAGSFAHIAMPGDVIRRFDSGLIIEPVDQKATTVLSVRSQTSAPNPGLAEGPGVRGLYVRCSGLNPPAAVFDFATGAPIDRSLVRSVRPFRLRWLDGKEMIDLLPASA